MCCDLLLMKLLLLVSFSLSWLHSYWETEQYSSWCPHGYEYWPEKFLLYCGVITMNACPQRGPEFSCFHDRGDRTINHVPDKGISKGHSQLLRIWDGKEVQFEVQNWHHNSIRSFHIRDGTNNGYLPGPEERYANWQNNVSNFVVRCCR